MLGVISASATAPSAEAYAALSDHPLVFLIDMSAEQVRRASNGEIKAGVDDLYWELAGWTD